MVFHCENLCKRYGKVQALEDVTFSIQPGHIVGLLGPTAAVKPPLSSWLTAC